jgi:hypothetical protein
MDLFKICKVMFIVQDGKADSNTKDSLLPKMLVQFKIEQSQWHAHCLHRIQKPIYIHHM